MKRCSFPITTKASRKPAVIALLAFFTLNPGAFAGSRTWTGAINGNWSNPSNWNPAGPPQDGDDLFFNGSDSNRSMNNDLSNLSVTSLNFGHYSDSSDYQLSGNQLTLGDIYSIPNGSSTITISCPLFFPSGGEIFASPDDNGVFTENTATLNLNAPITMSAGLSFLETGATDGAGLNAIITVSGPIYGNGGILAIIQGANNETPNDCVIRFNANTDNTFTGSMELNTVGQSYISFAASGVVVTNKITVGPFNGQVANLHLDGPNQIGNNATILLTGGAQLNLSGNNATVGSLVLSNYSGDTSASQLDTGTTTLALNGGVTSWNDSDSVTPTIKGQLALNGFSPFFVDGSSYAGLDLPAALGGDGFSKAGNKAMILRGASTFGGGVEVDQGILDVRSTGALSSGGPPVLLYGSGAMTLRASIANKSLEADGNQPVTAEAAGSLLAANSPTNVTWSGPIMLDTNLVVIGSDITLSGVISGPGGLEFLNTGTALLGGSSANTFSGATLARGALLELGKPPNVRALNGPLIVGGGAGGTSEVAWLSNFQDSYNVLNTTPSFTLYPNGYINVNNNTEIFGPITFNGGVLDSGPGGLAFISQPVTVNPANVSAVINGLLNLQGGTTALFTVADGPADCDLLVNAVVQGTLSPPQAYLVKQGAGTMCLAGANTYNAVTLLEEGVLDINNGSALGDVGCVIFNNATLRLEGTGVVVPNNFEMVGPGAGGIHGAVEVTPGSSYSLQGNILLDAATTLNVGSSGFLYVNGLVSGNGPLTKAGLGTMWFGSGVNNTYSGDTIVSAGALLLPRSPNIVAVPDNLVIGPAPAGQIALAQLQAFGNLGGSTVTVNANGLFDLNGFSQTLGQLNLNDGGSVQTGAGTLGFSSAGQITVGSHTLLGSHTGSVIGGNLGIAANAVLTFNVGLYAPNAPFDPGPELNVLANIPKPVELISFAPAGIAKNGGGRMRLGGIDTYQGFSVINAGRLQVDSIQPSSPVQVNAGGTLMGGGTVGRIFLADTTATVQPGDHPGILTSSNFNASGFGPGVLQIELNGSNFGQYDQLNVSGTVSLSGISLSPSLNYASAVGDQFTIINNDGTDPVSGTFNGLPQNANLYIGGQLFQINYSGGTGNDVVLSRLVTPPLPVLTIQSIPTNSVLLSWQANDPLFALQYSTDLNPTNWTPVTPPPVVIGSNNVVTNSAAGPQKFYRLNRPAIPGN